MIKKKILALDIGNVCVRIDQRNYAKFLGVDNFPPEVFELCRDFEWGKIREETAVFDRAAELMDHRFSPEILKEAFNSILIEAVPGMSELVSSLPALGITAVFFSDISPTHLQRTKELFPAFDAVSDGIFSFDAGNWKPSEEMFSAFEKRFDSPALYVDDREELIEAAKKRGWNAAVFNGAQDLREKLQALC